MSSGHIIKLGKGAKIKGGKVKIMPVYHDASAAIRAKKSKKITVKRKSAHA
jgi:hypothetical protein